MDVSLSWDRARMTGAHYDTRIELLPHGLVGGLVIPYGVRALRWGWYFTAESKISLSGACREVVRLFSSPSPPPMGWIVSHERRDDGFYVTFAPNKPAWPSLLDDVKNGLFYFCPKPAGGKGDYVDLWAKSYAIYSLYLTTQPCFAPREYDSENYAYAYLSDALGPDREIPQGLNPVLCSMEMERKSDV